MYGFGEISFHALRDSNESNDLSFPALLLSFAPLLQGELSKPQIKWLDNMLMKNSQINLFHDFQSITQCFYRTKNDNNAMSPYQGRLTI